MKTKLPALLLLLLLPGAARAAEPASVADANKALVRRYFDEALSTGRLEVLDELVATDFADRTPGAPEDQKGPDVIREAQKRAREIFPQIRYTIGDLIAEGDKVVARYTVQAATKETESAPSRKIEITGITIFRIAAGKIQEAWIINDQIEMFRQLGFTIEPPQQAPPPQPAPADQPASH